MRILFGQRVFFFERYLFANKLNAFAASNRAVYSLDYALKCAFSTIRLVMRFYAVPYAALNNYHVDRILLLIGHDKRLRNNEIYVILKVLYSEDQLY